MKRFILHVVLLVSLFGIINGEDVIVLGSLNQTGELIMPRQIKEGPDGNIYIYDLSDAYIKVYSSSGEFLKNIGGEGEGPGDIKRKDGLKFGFLPDDSLYFTNISEDILGLLK